jgi:hypothetical protein
VRPRKENEPAHAHAVTGALPVDAYRATDSQSGGVAPDDHARHWFRGACEGNRRSGYSTAGGLPAHAARGSRTAPPRVTGAGLAYGLATTNNVTRSLGSLPVRVRLAA